MTTSKFIIANLVYLTYVALISGIAIATQNTQYELVGTVAIFAIIVATIVPAMFWLNDQRNARINRDNAIIAVLVAVAN